MIYKQAYIELVVNGVNVDIESQESINIRINNVLYDPSALSSKQAEYSFSFDLPATPKNNKLFAYANNLSSMNKFIKTYDAKLYVDGQMLFSGSLTLNKYKDNKYNVNLVTIRAIDYDEIFGDTKMNELEWEIPFNGADSINDYNSRLETDVVFPLVSYGAFQKVPIFSDDVGNDYTSKFDLDQYNRWYIESFYPSTKVLTTVKKCFEQKGYYVDGDVFQDIFLNNIYQSVNLADEQKPKYNIGLPAFGKVDVSITARTGGDDYYEQELGFQYMPTSTVNRSVYYNFPAVRLYNLLNSQTKTINQPKSYMYQPNEGLIVIPADGFYRIDLDVDYINQTIEEISASRYCYGDSNTTPYEINCEQMSDMREVTPVEIQLVKNYDNDLELIKGRLNVTYRNGSPQREVFEGQTNREQWLTCYPHEDAYMSIYPTKRVERGEAKSKRWSRQSSMALGYTYMNQWTDIMPYDPLVNPNFICGVSTLSNGVPSVIKNGSSWNRTVTDRVNSFYNQSGYYWMKKQNGNISYSATTYNQNTYTGETPSSYFHSDAASAYGKVSCTVWLNRNDVLNLFAVQREFHLAESNVPVNYASNISCRLRLEAVSPDSYELLVQRNYGYNTPVSFPTELQLGEFFNSETEMQEYIQNVVKAFNWDVRQNGNRITINKKQSFPNKNGCYVDLDGKANSKDASVLPIEYPKSMAVRYKIDKEEYGFEYSVPSDKINLEDWYNYGNSGYSIINLSQKEGASEQNVDIPFSYTWYVPFNWYDVTSADTKVWDVPTTLNLPCISKSEYMIDGYDYSESLKHDGYGLAQRFWIRPRATYCHVWLDVYPQEKVFIYEPTNLYTNYRDVYFNLSYKMNEISILNTYFNITPYLNSNYIELEVYLTANEYNLVKSGANVRFDSDTYYVTEISGFDPSQNNPTNIKMIKRI